MPQLYLIAIIRKIMVSLKLALHKWDMFPFYWGQGKEDKILDKIIGKNSPGFYIDVGAHHPIHLNNTYFFYKKGWRGIAVEPNIEFVNIFEKERPEDIILNIALSDYQGQSTLYMGRHSVHYSLLKKTEGELSYKTVMVKKLEDVLDELHAPDVFDLISIDTEGTELDVLRGLNLKKYQPRLILIEYNTSSKINTNIQAYLINNGYHLIYINKWNMIFSKYFQTDIHKLFR